MVFAQLPGGALGARPTTRSESRSNIINHANSRHHRLHRPLSPNYHSNSNICRLAAHNHSHHHPIHERVRRPCIATCTYQRLETRLRGKRGRVRRPNPANPSSRIYPTTRCIRLTRTHAQLRTQQPENLPLYLHDVRQARPRKPRLAGEARRWETPPGHGDFKTPQLTPKLQPRSSLLTW